LEKTACPKVDKKMPAKVVALKMMANSDEELKLVNE